MAGLWIRQAVLVQRPAEVRMDVMSPFGLVMAIGTQRDLLWAYSPSDQVRFEGVASPDNLARFLGAPVSVGDLVDILMGLPPARVASRPPTLARAPDASWLVTLPVAGGEQRVWFGDRSQVNLGVAKDAALTIPKGQMKNLKASFRLTTPQLEAPLKKNQVVGTIDFQLDGKTIEQRPLVVMQDVPEGGFFSRMIDFVMMKFNGWFGKWFS